MFFRARSQGSVVIKFTKHCWEIIGLPGPAPGPGHGFDDELFAEDVGQLGPVPCPVIYVIGIRQDLFLDTSGPVVRSLLVHVLEAYTILH